ncbi:MAG: hypothetical protein ACK5CA_04560 [Cyanobacteriota bacterium]
MSCSLELPSSGRQKATSAVRRNLLPFPAPPCRLAPRRYHPAGAGHLFRASKDGIVQRRFYLKDEGTALVIFPERINDGLNEM